MKRAARILRRSDVAQLVTMTDCIAAVENAFRLLGEGKLCPPGILGMHVHDGGFHIKAAVMETDRLYFAAKLNANFPANPQRFGLPTIQGAVLLCDATDGYPLAVMDSIEVTILRTAAATAVAARRLARAESKAITICGCGTQASAQLRAIREVLPRLQHANVFDLDGAKARAFAAETSTALGMSVAAVTDLSRAIAGSDVVITCTPSRHAYLDRGFVRAGTFISAVGADHPEKSELAPALLAESKVVVDSLAQASTIGDLHHALVAGAMTTADVHAELADVVAGKKPGRTSDDEITIFDSTGVAIQDVAAAILVYERAAVREMGLTLHLGD